MVINISSVVPNSRIKQKMASGGGETEVETKAKEIAKDGAGELWQNSRPRLYDQNKYLLEKATLSDCAFLVGTLPNIKRFECHKLMLAKASPVFEAMLYRPHGDNNENDIKIDDVEPEIFQAMLKFIYTNNYETVDLETAFNLSCVSEVYILPSLQQKTYENLLLKLNPSNAIQAFEIAKELSTQVAKKMEQRARKMLAEYTADVLKADSFVDADHSSVLHIVQQDFLNVGEEELILACKKWAVKESEQEVDTTGLQKTLGEIFNHLRFLALTEKQLEIIKDCNLITENKIEKLRNRINSKSLNFQFFDEFCIDEYPRNSVEITKPKFQFNAVKSNYSCHTQCRNKPTLATNGLFYSNQFEVDVDVFLLGLECLELGLEENQQFPNWSIILKESNGKAQEVNIMHEENSLRLKVPMLITRNKKYTLTVQLDILNEKFLPKIDESLYLGMKQLKTILPDYSLIKSFVYCKV